jgi:hypothetical protein
MGAVLGGARRGGNGLPSRSAIKMIEASGRLMENVFLTVEDMPRE